MAHLSAKKVKRFVAQPSINEIVTPHLRENVSRRALEDVFVVIPAHGAKATLRECIERLREGSARLVLDVVIVHDDEEMQDLGQTSSRFCVREEKSDRSHNAGAARNFGARSATQGIIIFVDADVMVEAEALDRLLEPILDGRADATVGNYSDNVEGLSFFEAYKQRYVGMVYGRRSGSIRNEFWTGLGAIRAEVFHRLGGFSARFEGACGEDTELGQRLTGAGYRIHAVPEARGRHLHRFTLLALVKNDFRKGSQIMLNNFRHGNSLSDNRHTSRADVYAVAGASFSAIALMGGLVFPPAFGVAAVAFTLWALARIPLLRVMLRSGILFLIKSVPTALLLDFVRAFCVPAAFGLHVATLPLRVRAVSSEKKSAFSGFH